MPARRSETPGEIGSYIDYTLLKPEATQSDIERLCDEAVQRRLAAVCVNGAWVGLCAQRVLGRGPAVAAVVGFPLGAMSGPAKAAEASIAVADGATELDMVSALGPAKQGEWDLVADDVALVVVAARGATVKVIIESAILTPEEIVRACQAVQAGGAQFVKTSTGFHPAGGATVEAVALMRRTVGPHFGVKASGGIRGKDALRAMIAAGANRIGLSNLVGLDDLLASA